jgi:hypothetical protein
MKVLLTERQIQLVENYEEETEEPIPSISVPDAPSDKKELLKFSGVRYGNSKIAHPSFSIPAGHTCKFAQDCKSCADRVTGKLTDSDKIKFRCFAASQENYIPAVRMMRWHNYDLLKKREGNVKAMADLIDRSFKSVFPKAIPVLRLHVGGDFYSQAYFAAWMEMARRYPMMIIYAYTKALPFWIKHKDVIPANFRLTASKGGTHDFLIDTEHLKSAEVIFDPANAEARGLPIDHDDSHAAFGDEDFGLLLHNTQPPNTDASVAHQKLKKAKLGGYPDKRKKKLKEGWVYLVTEEQVKRLGLSGIKR